MESYDAIIVGSGIGGLSCASLLSLHGLKVLVCEAHSKPGGVAHSFDFKGYKFESGPSLWSGIQNRSEKSPLGKILHLLEEDVDIVKYKNWNVIFPESTFNLEVGYGPFRDKVKLLRGQQAVQEWDNFISAVRPISKIINKIPLMSFSPQSLGFSDLFNIVPKLILDLKHVFMIQRSFGEIADDYLNDPFLKNWVNLLCFLISGMDMNDTNTAAMATLFDEWFNPNSFLEYPKGGSESIVSALIRGIKKNKGKVMVSSKVDSIRFHKDVPNGIVLNNGMEISGKKIVLNCDIWSAKNLLPNKFRSKFKREQNINKCGSFLHIHLGFDAKGLDNLPIHTIWVKNWQKSITSERNVAVLSIPTVLDPKMAPKGKHVLHGYTPANEPWEPWRELKYNSKEYQKLKKDRCSVFDEPLKKLIPDIEKRIEIKMLGTPLTHKKFTNTFCGSYGPAISAKKRLFPGCKTPISNLYMCGASTFPGIGIPAVAASGAYAAEAIIGKKEYLKLIRS